MKLACALAGLFAVAVSGQGFAQTCASPTPLTGPSAGVGGSTCGGAVDEVNVFCGALAGDAPDAVYSFTAGPSPTATQITLSNSSPGWRPALYLLGGSGSASAAFCADGSTCAATASAANAGEGATLTVPALTNTNVYYLVVTAVPTAAANSCGDFTLAVNGTLPVQLRDFSID